MSAAIIILAAGESSRLGQPKQTLPFHGRPLLTHAVETARSANCGPVLVVLGSRLEPLRPLAANARVVENPNWAEGMASSIRAGVSALPPQTNGAILMTCDQPLISADFLKRLSLSGPIAAAEYNGTLGVPAFFTREFFPELLGLRGRQGAKPILLAHAASLLRLPCPEAGADIDTAGDFARLHQI